MTEKPVYRMKIFWPWQENEEEAWLREMTHQGLHLLRIAMPGVYAFRRGEPQDVVYRQDVQTPEQAERGVYLQLLQDAGWEYVTESGGLYYFRKAVEDGVEPELFTDNESRIEMYKRLMNYSAGLSPFVMVFYVIFLKDDLFTLKGLIMTVLFLGALALDMMFYVKMRKRIDELKAL